MGFFSNLGNLFPNPGEQVLGGLTGQTAADATLEGARIQAGVGREGIELQRETRDQLIGLQQPFLKFGEGQIGALQGALSNNTNPLLGLFNQTASTDPQNAAFDRLQELNTPQGQTDFITNNPFFDQLAGEAQNRLFSNAAARGKVGSGGTAAALQERLFGIGSGLLNQERANLSQTAGLTGDLQSNRLQQLLSGVGINADVSNQNINNLFRGVGLGQNAASLTGTGVQNAGDNITNLLTGIGDSQAAGGIGAANAFSQGGANIATLLASFFGGGG